MGTCPSCGGANAPGARFCQHCAAALGDRCRTCSTELPHGARFCPTCATPVDAPTPATDERKLVTVLFADVVGSTALGERLDPERIRAIMRSYFAVASNAVEAWGGTVEKFIGDAIVAIFGVPIVREDDAHRALRAARDLLARVEDVAERTLGLHGVTLAVRVGVNTGEVIAAGRDVAAAEGFVAGDAVNVASRLQQAADPGTVLCGERTWLATRDEFEFGEPVELDLKGKSAAVRARRLVGMRPLGTRGVRDLRAPMIGRDRELDALADALSDVAASGAPRLVLVYGPAGIGKSRLLQEFVRASSAWESRPTVLRGRCLAAGPGVTYWPLAEILRSASGISLDEPADAAVAKLTTRVGAILEPLGLRPTEVEETIQALATTAGLALRDNPLDRLEPQRVADRLAQAWPRFASALAAAGPAAIVVEDLHWAADELLAMLERLLVRSSGPLLVVATARPEFAHSHPGFLAGREDATTITVRPLTPQQATTLVAELLAQADLPADVRSAILERAEGNPFFVEEMLRRLIDEGSLVRVRDRWLATASISVAQLPDTVHGLLAARIDALPLEEKRVLQEAAVVGRIFWEDPLRAVLPDADVSTALRGLEGRGLVAARPTSTITGQVEYIFKHALVREVAYAGLPRSRRARSNAGVAHWIEQTAPDRRDEFLDLLAHFYQAAVADEDADLAWADDPETRETVRGRAVTVLVEAGDAARHRYELDLARERHRRALELARTDDERARAAEALGDDEEAAFHGEESWAAYQEAAAVARRRGDGHHVAQLALKAARVATRVGTFRTPPDITSVERFVDEGLAGAPDEAVRARLLVEKGAHLHDMWTALKGTDPLPFAERLAAVEEAVAIAARLDEPDLMLEAEEGRGALHWARADFDAAVESNRRQVELADRASSPVVRALAYYEASLALRDVAGSYADGLELARRSYALAQHLSPHELMHATAQWIIAAYWLGRWDEIEPRLAEHMAAFDAEQDRACSSVRSGPVVAALVRAQRGDARGARELLEVLSTPTGFGGDSPAGLAALVLVELGDVETALSRAIRAPSSHRRVAFGFHHLGYLQALMARGDWDGLGAALADAREAVGQMRLLAPAADRAEGRMFAATGRRDDAEVMLRRALAGYEALRVPFEAARTRAALAELVAGPEADALRAAALATFEQLGAVPDATRLQAAMRPPPGATTDGIGPERSSAA